MRPTKGHAAQGPRGRGRGRRQRARVPAAGRLPQTVRSVRVAASCEAAASLGPRRLFSVELSEEAWDEMANWAFVSRKQRGSDRGWGRAAKGAGVPSRPLSTSLLTPKCGAGANPANRGSRRLLRPRPPRVTSSSTGDRRATLRALSVDCSTLRGRGKTPLPVALLGRSKCHCLRGRLPLSAGSWACLCFVDRGLSRTAPRQALRSPCLLRRCPCRPHAQHLAPSWHRTRCGVTVRTQESGAAVGRAEPASRCPRHDVLKRKQRQVPSLLSPRGPTSGHTSGVSVRRGQSPSASRQPFLEGSEPRRAAGRDQHTFLYLPACLLEFPFRNSALVNYGEGVKALRRRKK